jgi:DNA-binding PadR family transcriptional regulator
MSNILLDMAGQLPRLSNVEENVISQLIGREKYGLELVAASDGVLKRNAIYVLLGRMEEKGLIEGREEAAPAGSSGPPRRVYRVTGHGQRVLLAYQAGMAILRGAH